jgi:hypothetical protein
MKQLSDKNNLSELLSIGKNLEDQARKVYEMSEAFAQKYEQRLQEQQPNEQDGSRVALMPKTLKE